jgi:hypothetical protein
MRSENYSLWKKYIITRYFMKLNNVSKRKVYKYIKFDIRPKRRYGGNDHFSLFTGRGLQQALMVQIFCIISSLANDKEHVGYLSVI